MIYMRNITITTAKSATYLENVGSSTWRSFNPFSSAALALQIRNERHFYQYGEAERLMTPVFYLGLRSSLTSEEWDTWFASLLSTSLDLKKTTQASLARKHNLSAFLSALYVNLQESKQIALQEKLLPIVIKSMKKLN